MKLSIIMPTFKRTHLLKWGLKSLSLQTKPENYELIILDEGLPEDNVENICKEFDLNIRYIFTGQRNLDRNIILWRMPCYAINIGIKQSLGKNIIITCPEIYHLDDSIMLMIKEIEENDKQMIITNGKDDRNGIFLNALNKNIDKENLLEIYNIPPHENGIDGMQPLNTEFPFFMAMNKQEVMDIGGYDEDFGKGYCWDDQDFVERMVTNENKYNNINTRIVHLYHLRQNIPGETEKSFEWLKNKALFEQRKNQIKRNIDKEWGKL